MPTMKAAALAYAKRGWPIFPCKADKSPWTQNGVYDATTNIEQIEKWWEERPTANIGLNVGEADMMVLDLDPGHDMKELESNVGELPSTQLVAETPRGGKHLFFAISDGERVSASASKLAPHVDVRSFHSYVLLTPSATSDGKYGWLSEGDPTYRTEEMLRAANSGRDKHKDRDEWIIEPDLEEHVALAAKWLREDAKIGIRGEGGNHTTYATAAMMKSYGLSEAAAMEAMWEHWCPRCSPPWDEGGVSELEQTINNAYGYNTSPPGNMTEAWRVANRASLFQSVVVQKGKGNEWTKGRFRFVDREGMQSIQPPDWLIPDFIPQEAYVMLFGAWSAFKTFLALDIALSVAAGIGLGASVNWPTITQSGPVLFAAGEGRANITNRVRAWEQTHFDGNRVKNFVLVDPVPLITEGIDDFVDQALDIHPDGYALTVLDTVGRSMQGTNENAQENASAFTQMVQVFQKALGTSVMALHHVGKTDDASPRGSSVFGAEVDTLLRVERAKKEYLVSLSMLKQKDGIEWKDPRYVQLEEVNVTPETTSLVAINPGELEVEQKEAVAFSNKEPVDTELLDIIEDRIFVYLQGLPGKSVTTNALGQAIATYPNVTVSGQQVVKGYLVPLREDNNRKASRLYDRDTKLWQWVG